MTQTIAVLTIGALAGVFGVSAAAQATAHRLEDDHMSITWDQAGAVTEVVDKSADTRLVTPAPGAAQGMSLLLRHNDTSSTVYGNDQTAPQIETDGMQCRIVWDGPLTDDAGDTFDIAVTATYGLEGGELAVVVEVDNRSNATVVEIRYPQIPGLAGFRPDGDSEAARLMPLPRGHEEQVFDVPFTAYLNQYPGWSNVGFMTLVHEGMNRGFYMGAHDETPRLKMWRIEEVGPEDDRDIAAWLVHRPYLPPGEQFTGSPWILAFHDGDWVEGGQIYREWFIDSFGLRSREDDWIREKHFYQMIMMMLPEGNINYRFEDVPDLARQGLEYGIDSLQLAGWQRGGHDNGYPYYEPDPRLGNWDDVERAIRECQEMGVKVYFFVNIHNAMLDLDWYEEELHKYVSLNHIGQINWIGYWGMGTVASRLAYTVPGVAFLDVSFPGIADPTLAYFKRLAELGADGLHIDKVFPNGIEYNPRIAELGLSPDVSPWKGTLELIERIDRECRAMNPDFAISFECGWDRLLTYGTATWWAGNMTVARRIFPELTETVGHYWPYDFFNINNSMREGWVVMLSPHRFNRGMDFRPWRTMAEYVEEAKRIRDRFEDIIFLGERRHGDKVAFEGVMPGGVEYAVWRDPKKDREAVVLTNTGRDAGRVTIEAIEGRRPGPVRIVRPFEEDIVAMLPVEVAVPGEQYALVVEDPESRREARRYRPAAEELEVAVSTSDMVNPDFETGDLTGWEADPNWTVDDNSAGGWYSGWQGRWFAWSGKGGEDATGKLRSKPFTLDKDGVELLVAGWADIQGRTPDRWNYVTLNLADGTELDRVYAPNTTTFTPMVLDGRGHQGEQVYIEAVDDADEEYFSMLCIDHVQTVAIEPDHQAEALAELNPERHIRLENEHYLVMVDNEYGTIRRIQDKQSGLELILEPRLANNYTFALPVVGHEAWTNTEANYIHGKQQVLTGHSLNGTTLTLEWGGPLTTVFGVFHDVGVEMTIALDGEQIAFDMTIDNRTDLEIGEVYYPIIGGTLGLGESRRERRDTTRTVPSGAGSDSARVYHSFINMTPFGELYPEQVFVYPHTLSMPWMHLYAPMQNRGVYVGAHDPVRRVKTVQLTLEPGIASSRADGNWPRPEELDGDPAGVSFNFVHMAYHPPGERFEATPVVMRFHDGDAADAARFYGEWFANTFEPSTAETPDGFREVGRMDFADLAEEAAQAREEGHDALLLNDWKVGGQNNGIADFRPDPDLGGVDGLREAVAACHDAGVKVFLRFNLQLADPDTEFHAEHMADFVSTDRWGVPFTNPGNRWVWLNPGAPALRERLVGQVEALAETGIDGLFVAEYFTNQIDFNPVEGMTADRVDWDGGMKTLEALLDAGRAVQPNFALVTNTVRDHLTTLAHPATEKPEATALFGRAFPAWAAEAENE